MNVMRNYIKQIILLGRIDIKLKSINFSILQQNKIPDIKNCIHSTDLSIIQDPSIVQEQKETNSPPPKDLRIGCIRQLLQNGNTNYDTYINNLLVNQYINNEDEFKINWKRILELHCGVRYGFDTIF